VIFQLMFFHGTSYNSSFACKLIIALLLYVLIFYYKHGGVLICIEVKTITSSLLFISNWIIRSSIKFSICYTTFICNVITSCIVNLIYGLIFSKYLTLWRTRLFLSIWYMHLNIIFTRVRTIEHYITQYILRCTVLNQIFRKLTHLSIQRVLVIYLDNFRHKLMFNNCVWIITNNDSLTCVIPVHVARLKHLRQ
jgi:hypothetical protein